MPALASAELTASRNARCVRTTDITCPIQALETSGALKFAAQHDYVQRASASAARAEPAADAQSFAPRRQHFMLAARCEKTHETACDRLDVSMAIGCVEKTQFACGGGRPIFVQVKHERHLALRMSLRLIDVARVAGAGRIPCVMQFEFE